MALATNLPDKLLNFMRQRVRDGDFADYLRDLLFQLVQIDTSPVEKVALTREREHRCLALCRRELGRWLPEGAIVEQQPIRADIKSHPYFTPIHYLTSTELADERDVSAAYADRYNLLVSIGAQDPAGQGAACTYNAHVDTVAPHVPPRVAGNMLYGRGAADDKGNIALMIGQLRLLAEITQRLGLAVAAPRLYQLVIDEETGGNGSLSASLDDRFADYQVVVMEVTSLLMHPANRGAVWYRADLSTCGDKRVNLAEMAARVVLALEQEGAKIKAESRHALFRPTHVQTCHGIMGRFGEHPSAVNDRIDILLPQGVAAAELIDQALAQYVADYGDKTKEQDESGRPKVERHYRTCPEGETVRIQIFGKAGHMGAIHQCDCAIIKAAYVIVALCEAGLEVALADGDGRDGRLRLEGGQGMVPTHPMVAVQSRLAQAARRAVEAYCARRGTPFSDDLIQVSYDKLHNEAFACRLDAPAMKAMESVCRQFGRDWPEPTGWDVSCDARVFAHRGQQVMCWGVGQLARVHRPDEVLSLAELGEGVALAAAFALAVGGISGAEQ